MTDQLRKAGFRTVRRCQFGDAQDPAFREVESESRFERAIALEAIK